MRSVGVVTLRSVVDSQSRAQKQEAIKKDMVNDWLMISPQEGY